MNTMIYTIEEIEQIINAITPKSNEMLIEIAKTFSFDEIMNGTAFEYMSRIKETFHQELINGITNSIVMGFTAQVAISYILSELIQRYVFLMIEAHNKTNKYNN